MSFKYNYRNNMEFGVRLYYFKVVALVHGNNGISIVSVNVFCSYYILYR